jgi:hypothetical protein
MLFSFGHPGLDEMTNEALRAFWVACGLSAPNIIVHACVDFGADRLYSTGNGTPWRQRGREILEQGKKVERRVGSRCKRMRKLVEGLVR